LQHPTVFPILEKITDELDHSLFTKRSEKEAGLFADLASRHIDFSAARYLVRPYEKVSLRVDFAISMYRILTDDIGEVGLLRFAVSLDNLTKVKQEMGVDDNILDHALEVVRLFRQLAVTEGDLVTPSLGYALLRLALIESGLDQRERAVADGHEALTIFEQLSINNGSEFYVEYVQSLHSLGHAQVKAGDIETGLSNARQAEESVAKRLWSDRATYLPVLATMLSVSADLLCDVGKNEDGLASAIEAASYIRELLESDRTINLSRLANLIRLSAMETIAGQHRRALESTQEAVNIGHELTEREDHRAVPYMFIASRRLESLKNAPEAGR
jgi:hypothetical protein